MRTKSMASLATKGKSKTPIEDTIRENLPDIIAVARMGHSRAAVWTALGNEGFHVGSKSGFRLALARVAQAKGLELAELFPPRRSVGDEPEFIPREVHGNDGQCAALPASDGSDASIAAQTHEHNGEVQTNPTDVDEAPANGTFADPRYTSEY